MEVPPQDLVDLLQMVEVPVASDSGSVSGFRDLPALQPSLVLRADADGKVLAAEDFGSGGSAQEAPRLAGELGTRLAGQEACCWEACTEDGPRRALAVRLPECADGDIVACLLRGPSPLPEQLEPTQAALVLCGALAAAVDRQRSEHTLLRTRVEHLLAQHDTLRASHAEAIAAAIAEREERLRQQQEHTSQLQAIMMMAADGILTTDEQGTIESFNAAAGRIFLYRPEEVLGRNVSMLIPQPDRQRHVAGITRDGDAGIAGFIGLGGEVIGQRKDGSTFPMDLAVSQVTIGDRQVFTGIFRDITERKRAEEELKQLHLQNEMILNSAGEGIFGLDQNGRATFVNPAAARMLGWQAGDLIGKFEHALIHHTRPDGSAYPWSECPVQRTLRDGTVSSAGAEVFWKKGGGSFPIEYSCTPIHEGERIVGAVVTFRDITERRMLEAQLRQAQKLESIGQLAAGIAHEINTPTQYIGDNTRFLQDAFQELRMVLAECGRLATLVGQGDALQPAVGAIVAAAEQADLEYLLEEIPKAIEQSLEGVQRVAKIVRSMKEFSHPGGESMQAIDLNRAIESTLTVSRNEWKYVAELVTDFDPGLPLVTCLPSDLNQVILNLIVNAAHAIGDKLGRDSEAKGTITVATRRQKDCVEIRVTDTGTGIPDGIRARVFDPFFTTKEVGRGTGQGLAIAHSVVTEKHHGRLWFETEAGAGTTFFIQLPLCQEPPTS